MRHYLLFFATELLVFTTPGISTAQKPQKRFEHLTIEHGLSQNTVNIIFKDSHGFMWFGTNDGLNKYDGYSFKIYRQRPNDTTSISSNKIYAIAEDDRGDIWIGTNNGLNRYSREQDNFDRYYKNARDTNSLSHNFVRGLYVSNDQKLYIGTLGGGLNIFDLKLGTFTRSKNLLVTPDETHINLNIISSIIEDKEGSIWVGANINGFVSYDDESDSYSVNTFSNAPLANTHYLCQTLYEGKDGDIWLCTEGDGLYKWDKSALVCKQYTHDLKPYGLTSDIVKGMHEDDEGNIWIATDGGGLVILNMENNSFYNYKYDVHDPKGINSNALYSLFVDEQGIVWIGTFNGGVNIFNPHKKAFLHYTQNGNRHSLSHKSVLCFLEESKDMIWIGTDGGGLNKFNPKTGSFEVFMHNPKDFGSLSSNVITTLYMDRQQNLWIGTYQGGLMRYQSEHNSFESFRSSHRIGLENDNVWSLLEDSRSNFWVGTLGGLYIFDRKKEFFERMTSSTPEEKLTRIICLMEDNDGKIWVGGNGLSIYDPDRNSWKFHKHIHNDSTSLGANNVRTIYQDGLNRIWIGTEGAGLNLYHPKRGTFSKLTGDDGLANNSVHKILEDKQGRLWISSNKGLSKITFTDKGGFRIKNYDESDGLQSNQFSYGAAMKTRSGEMYFGGVNGFNIFNPDEIEDNRYVPPVKITGFKINEREVEIGTKKSPLHQHISVTNELTLSYEQSRVFSFEFTALNFTSPEKNRYAYQLEGFDHEGGWVHIGNRRTATYTNLNAGEYTFKVIGSNNDGVWNMDPTTLKIEVMPPYWKSWWAYSLYVLLFTFVVLSMRRITIERIHLKNDIKLKELEKCKTEEINQAKLNFFTSISHEFRTPLTLIIGPLKKLLEKYNTDDETGFYCKLIYRNAKRLLHLIDELMDFRKIEHGAKKLCITRQDLISFLEDIKLAFDNLATQKGIDFRFEKNLPVCHAWFDKDIIDKVCYNLLSNAFKFTPSNEKIELKIKITDKIASITICDTGIGISQEALPHIFDRFYHLDKQKNTDGVKGTGIGLALSYELIKLHHGKIEVVSKPDEGSSFTIVLPITDEAYSSEEIMRMELAYSESHLQVEDYLPFSSDETTDPQGWPALSSDPEKPLILLVEDNEELRSFLNKCLQKDYRILEAGDGRDGLARSFETIPDLIISDVMMPHMNGIIMCNQLKADERTNHIPIILLTAKSTIQDKIDGLSIGVDEYIFKPFHTRILEIKVKNLIEQRKALRKKFSNSFLDPEIKSIPSADEKFLNKVFDIIEKHIADPTFDVDVFAREVNMSRSVLYRKLRAVTNQSVNELISNVRLKRATQLLSHNSMNISEVAYALGYNDPQYFSKCFRKKYKKTPSEFMAVRADHINT